MLSINMDSPDGNKENMAAENGAKETSPLEDKIIKQVEYYFGDMNLPRDRFLQDQISQDEGWVTLETMLKFNRLKQLSDDQEVIAAALQKSVSGLLEVSEDKKKIRRSPDKPIPDNTKERRDEIVGRTVYAKGFPLDHTLDQLQEFFTQHGKTENIQMRRIPKTKDFKGSVFVVFQTKEDADKFVKAESIKCGDVELTRHLKEDYFKKKTEEKKQSKKHHGDESKEKDDKIKESIVKATILRLDGLPGDILMEDIKNFFNDFGKVAWVDHDKGDTKGFVRFHEENQATDVLTKAKEAGEGKIEINNNEVEARVLDGEEELNHWKNIFKTREDYKNKKSRNMQGGRRGRQQRGFKGKKRFHQGERGAGEPAAKIVKTGD